MTYGYGYDYDYDLVQVVSKNAWLWHKYSYMAMQHNNLENNYRDVGLVSNLGPPNFRSINLGLG